MKHDIPHDLDVATAKKVTDRAFAAYAAEYPDYKPTLAWANDRKADISFSAKGIKLSGAMHISEKLITMELDVPFLLRVFQGKAISVIEREVKVWIAKAKRGEL